MDISQHFLVSIYENTKKNHLGTCRIFRDKFIKFLFELNNSEKTLEPSNKN